MITTISALLVLIVLRVISRVKSFETPKRKYTHIKGKRTA